MNSVLIGSFVVRIYCDPPALAQEAPCWRVVVRHVQTGEERHFAQPAEALSFLEEMAVAASSELDQSGTSGTV